MFHGSGKPAPFQLGREADADFARGAELMYELGGSSSGSASANPDRQLPCSIASTSISSAACRAASRSCLPPDTAEHRVVLTPGTGAPNLAATERTVRCAISDFLAMQRGSANPFELMMNGKIQISGNAQIPMARARCSSEFRCCALFV
jgi:hypothetical protein